MAGWFSNYIKDPLQNGWNKIKDAFKKDDAGKQEEGNQQPGFFKKVGNGLKSIPGFFLGKGTVEDLTTPGWKNKLKGLGKAALVLGAMIGVGLLTGGAGFFVATGFALAAGVATQKLATKLGSKGIERSSKDRSESMLNTINNKLVAKKQALEKSKSRFEGTSKWMGRLMKIGLVASVAAAIFVPPLLIFPAIAALVGGGAKYFSDKAVAKSEASLKDFGTDNIKNMSKEKQLVLGLKNGFIKEKDLVNDKGEAKPKVGAAPVQGSEAKNDKSAGVAKGGKSAVVQAATASKEKEGRKNFEAEDLLNTSKQLIELKEIKENFSKGVS